MSALLPCLPRLVSGRPAPAAAAVRIAAAGAGYCCCAAIGQWIVLGVSCGLVHMHARALQPARCRS